MTILMIQDSKVTPTRHLEVQESIFIDSVRLRRDPVDPVRFFDFRVSDSVFSHPCSLVSAREARTPSPLHPTPPTQPQCLGFCHLRHASDFMWRFAVHVRTQTRIHTHIATLQPQPSHPTPHPAPAYDVLLSPSWVRFCRFLSP